MTTFSQHSIGTAVFIHGPQAIDTHHMIERRFAEAHMHRLLTSNRDNSQPSGFRHLFGSMMITFGAFIAGKNVQTAHSKDRQATMPAPCPESGFVPSR